MIVYRFEKNGIGPYISRTGIFIINSDKDTRTKKKYMKLRQKYWYNIDEKTLHNNWRRAHMDKRYMYGCSSKEQLKAYFAGSFKTLFKMGFRIKRYKVPDNQVIDMGIEVAFPVRYHKFQTASKLKKVTQ